MSATQDAGSSEYRSRGSPCCNMWSQCAFLYKEWIVMCVVETMTSLNSNVSFRFESVTFWSRDPSSKMAAGIVASTLRRKAFHRRGAGPDTRYQAIEPGHIAVSPTDDTSPGGKPRDINISPRLPRGAQLSHRDFWPSCQNPSEPVVFQLIFDKIGRAHVWTPVTR